MAQPVHTPDMRHVSSRSSAGPSGSRTEVGARSGHRHNPSPAHALIPYTSLVEDFNAAPPGKLYLLHGSATVFRLSLSAAAHVLLNGVSMTLVDGTNRFDLYYIADFARTATARRAGCRVRPEDLLNNIFISRAFTCYQMEALITDRLSAFIDRVQSPVVTIFGLLDTFYDDQAPLFEVRKSLGRIIVSLERLKRKGVSVLLASLDVRLASKERNGLFPQLASSMDRVFLVSDDGGVPRIRREVWPRGVSRRRSVVDGGLVVRE